MSKDPSPKCSTCGDRGRVTDVPLEVKPVVVPVPPVAVPVEVTDDQVAARVAVDGAPEEDDLALLWNAPSPALKSEEKIKKSSLKTCSGLCSL